MHIPDGFLSNQVNFSFIAISSVIVGFAFKKTKDLLFEKTRVVTNQLMTNIGTNVGSESLVTKLKENANKKIGNMAVLAALIFSLQMLNFPVLNGTSGHLIGGVLAAMVLGPWLGLLVISAVLIIQAIMFGDGGILALGANIFNMGIIASVSCYYLYLCCQKIIKNKYLAIALTSWISVLLAAAFCSLELAFSHTISLGLVLPAMVFIHSLIGIGEALITVLAIRFLFNDEIYDNAK